MRQEYEYKIFEIKEDLEEENDKVKFIATKLKKKNDLLKKYRCSDCKQRTLLGRKTMAMLDKWLEPRGKSME